MSASANYVRRTIELEPRAGEPGVRNREAAFRKADLERINLLAGEAGLITRKEGVNDSSKYRRWLRGNFRVGSAVSLEAEARAEVIGALERLIAERGA
ncbi:MAG TPA: hypothetical protein VE262_21900 [Blastocatellia bacterium]|nr:hypothetical protein [Blastocatellia bacterium]